MAKPANTDHIISLTCASIYAIYSGFINEAPLAPFIIRK